MRFQDKVCLITGGAAGIGKAAVEAFAREGARVVFCDLAQEAGEDLAAQIKADFFNVDVTDRQAVQGWVDAVVEKYGRVDVLINNAGVWDFKRRVSKDGIENIFAHAEKRRSERKTFPFF